MSTAEATYAQHAVWFTEQAGVAGTAYHMALGIWFAADLDRTALATACATVLARHPVLATRVDDTDGVPRLVPAAPGPALREVDLADGSFDDAVTAEIARRHDLRTGPLARFLLLTGADDRRLLLVTAHHLVFDGMSKDVLVRDLATAYDAARSGRPADLPAATTGYADRAAVERDRVAAESAAARDHWATHWSGPGGVVLPGSTRTPTAAEPGNAVRLTLAPDLVSGLDQARRKLGVTRFELLLTVLHTVLARYGNDQVPVGVGLSTRTAGTADEVGLFVNELPVRVAVTDGSFREHALAVREQVRALNAFRCVPLAHVVTGLRPATSVTPVSFGYRRRGPEPVFDQVATTVEWTLFGGAARNALHVQVVDGPHPDGTDTVELSLQHSPAVLPVEAVARIGSHLQTMLAAVTTDPEQPVVDLPLLPADELELVCRAWNTTGRAVAPQVTVLTLVAEQVRRDPAAVAVVDGAHSLSYAELDRASARLAELLRARGVEPGSLVAVALDRSWQAIVALLAVLRCRAGYVPVDPTYPPARQEMILADADPVLVLTTAAGAGQLPAGTPALALDQVDLTGPAAAETSPSVGPQPGPADLAYVLYTSGSTGRPKGVAVPHGALANLVLAMREQFGGGPQHRWLHLTSLAFDISAVEIYLPLTTGGRVVVAAGVSALDGAGVLRLARQAGVTHLQATPSGWRVLLEAGLDDRVVAVTGGEALPVPLARRLRARVDRLVNGYGPTEATIYATMAQIEPEPTEVTIGRPVANTTAYLLDEHRRPVPIGVAGELYLGGRGVATGYLHRPELTAERFVTDPFGGADGADAGIGDSSTGRLYRTGDICRWLPDGRIEFLGRADDQVKIRGHRVELGEITARLLEHPSVAQAAVLLTAGNGADDNAADGNGADDGAGRLVAYLVPQGAAPTVAQLRQHLTLTLPTAMVPAAWVLLDQLPTSPNGKLDRAALPKPDQQPADTGAGDVADPVADPIVEEIRLIWQDVLQIADIGVDEDLFDLGGHSLTVTRISSRIHRRLGVEVPLETFFDAPTIAEIAEIVRETVAGR
ncbi:non-ribosomal peptide synthetase [Micromonospora sp. NBC_01813]|uniref:non-ribosomal peptide synthetase n=1 Tax=Micromonospora sp. NBC_01813 TaxID=2975988 RepID=UPI002DDB532F|nr:amino acid adenylation domain-containing protein [Micromonospora sp. NBC_01813]WSA09029.1 amino acid adenylation domain-containing protein [Micromonospora sp. NBC_01813]